MHIHTSILVPFCLSSQHTDLKTSPLKPSSRPVHKHSHSNNPQHSQPQTTTIRTAATPTTALATQTRTQTPTQATPIAVQTTPHKMTHQTQTRASPIQALTTAISCSSSWVLFLLRHAWQHSGRHRLLPPLHNYSSSKQGMLHQLLCLLHSSR